MGYREVVMLTRVFGSRKRSSDEQRSKRRRGESKKSVRGRERDLETWTENEIKRTTEEAIDK